MLNTLRPRRAASRPAAVVIAGVFALLGGACRVAPPSPDATPELPTRPVATYSIVARDPATGELGVAVQSHWFSVGSVVSWAEAGVGAVATQSLADPSYGPLGLDLMRAGRSAPDALAGLLAADSGREVRQVAMIDARGNVNAHTGARCIAAASHVLGENFSVQANLMDRDGVPEAMAAAFRSQTGDLASRLIAALRAAQSAGGDVRGKQSAALLVVPGAGSGRPWADRRFDLRVEDHATPVEELARLLRLARAYEALNEGDEHLGAGDIEAALEAYRHATELVPDAATHGEAAFWVGVTLASEGREAEAIPYLQRAAAQQESWVRVLPRLVEPGLFPDDSALLERLQTVMNFAHVETVMRAASEG